MARRSILKIARRVAQIVPRGKTFIINCSLALFGNTFGDEIAVADGRTFRINKITPLNRRLFFLNKYEDGETEIVKKLVTQGDVVIDIGANFGWYSTLMSSLTGERGRVYSFEVVPEIAKELQENISLNQMTNVVIENIAIGEDDLETDYVYSESWGTGNQKLELLNGGGQLKSGKSRSTSLDSYLLANAINKVDFIKCDIDGAEVPFIRGAQQTLKSKKPIMIIEAHERDQRAHGHSCQQLFSELRHIGYRLFSLDKGLRSVGSDEMRMSDFAYNDNWLCLRDEKLDILKILL